MNGGYGLYYLGNEKKVLRYDVSEEEDADFVRLNDILANLGENFRGGKTLNDARSLEQFLEDAGVPPRMMSMANAGALQICAVGCRAQEAGKPRARCCCGCGVQVSQIPCARMYRYCRLPEPRDLRCAGGRTATRRTTGSPTVLEW